ncbi:MAG: DUF4157 domain-containing protein [Acinetobacter sp.]
MKRATLIVFTVASITSQLSCASWLSEITGLDIDLNRGSISIKEPRLDKIPEMIENLPKDATQALINPAAPVAATAIRFSRGQALNRGTNPIPSNIREQLKPYFPDHILNKVKWTTANGISLDGALKNWFNQEGAITLDEVIVFSNNNLANDVSLWAHELTHVLQYNQMGVETFAFQYLIDWNGLESQARTNQMKITQSIQASQQGQTPNWAYTGSASTTTQNQIQWSQLNQIAQETIPASNCIWINQESNTTGNSCPIPIRVTGVVMQRMQDGYTFTAPCNEPTCNFMPNQAGPLLSPPYHRIIGVTAAYPLSY